MVAEVLALSSLDLSLSPLCVLLGITQSQDVSCPPESPTPGAGWETAFDKYCPEAEHHCCMAIFRGDTAKLTKVGVTSEKGDSGGLSVCRDWGRERYVCVCKRAHRSPSLRMKRDSSKCDWCQHDLEGGRRWVMGVRVTAARGVLAPSQGRGERCLRVRLDPGWAALGPWLSQLKSGARFWAPSRG